MVINNLNKSRMMSDEDFMKLKTEIKIKRISAIKNIVKMEGWSKETEEWLVERPTNQPSSELNEYCNKKGPTYSFKGYRGKGIPKNCVTFYEDDMITFAERLAKNSDVKVALLNMANPIHVGGGFMNGARAQEEQLCHRSNLFPRLKQFRWYGGYPIHEGTCLVTPNVDILLGDGPDFTPLRKTSSVTIISAAAKKYDKEPPFSQNLFNYLLDTWVSVLTAADASGCTDVVVSAIGAGAFHNPPNVVGSALSKALTFSHSTSLRHVHVVIMNDHNSRNNVERFRKGFEYN